MAFLARRVIRQQIYNIAVRLPVLCYRAHARTVQPIARHGVGRVKIRRSGKSGRGTAFKRTPVFESRFYFFLEVVEVYKVVFAHKQLAELEACFVDMGFDTFLSLHFFLC